MTNAQYEKASVEAAMGQRKLAAVDAKITETEQTLVYLLHQRREIVNQYDLNKKRVCDHDFESINLIGMPAVTGRCCKCGVAK